MSEQAEWNHIAGADNPADLLTRGMSTVNLNMSGLWWHGPAWVKLDGSHWAKWNSNSSWVENMNAQPMQCNSLNVPNMMIRSKKGKPLAIPIANNIATICTHFKDEQLSLINKFSNLNKLLRITAYVFRFIDKLKAKNRRGLTNNVSNQDITVIEQESALKFWVQHTQMLFYGNEIQALVLGKQISNASSIVRLTPFLDDASLLRVAGRLENSELPYETKYQLIIHPQSRLAYLLVMQMHDTTKHGGAQLVIGQLRRSYWINRIRQVVKSVIHRCVTCKRFARLTGEQLMGQLPMERVSIGEPFARSGIDFAGPFLVTRAAGRPTRSSAEGSDKAWIAIFICLITRAVHVEVLFGLTVGQFLGAFERFTTRKGRCLYLHSDNGTTFVGADNELARVLKQWSTSFPTHELSRFGTEWRFITPAAPFKGGIWEAAVKSFKHHLKRVMGKQRMKKEEFVQIAIQIEGCLNSRPLWPVSDDPQDLQAITPADLVLGKPILSQPLAEYVAEEPDNRLSWFEKRQKIHQQLWSQWQETYLTSLQVRQKWFRFRENIRVDDLVIIQDENMPPTQWCLGRVIQIFPGLDGLVRSARIKTYKNTIDRPITKLAVLLTPMEVRDPATSGEADL